MALPHAQSYHLKSCPNLRAHFTTHFGGGVASSALLRER
jgi:hypothetical protein